MLKTFGAPISCVWESVPAGLAVRAGGGVPPFLRAVRVWALELVSDFGNHLLNTLDENACQCPRCL